jgi:Porin PorA
MRGIIGLILAGLGACLILVAVLLPTWVVGQVVKFPLNEYETATLDASNASYFSTTSLTEKTGVNLEATYTIKGNGSAGNSSTAVWNEYSYVYDLTNHQAVQQMSRTFAFDRRTGQLVNCCGASLNGDTSVRQSGLVGYVFPFGTQKQTYQVFNTSLKKTVPFVYSGTTSVDGVQAYEFVQNVPPTQIGTQTLPGSFVKSAAATVTLGEYDQEHVIYYVDPETGALIDVNEQQSTTLRTSASAAPALVGFDADLIATPASVTQIVALDSSGRNELTLIETTLPIVLGIVGGVALLAGILLRRKPHEDLGELDDVSREAAAPDQGQAVASGSGRHAADGAGIVPGLGDKTAELAADRPDGEGPDGHGSPSAG